MTGLEISIPDDLAKRMEVYPEINWNSIIRNTIKNFLNNLELIKLSKYLLKEFLENEPDIYTDQDLIKRFK